MKRPSVKPLIVFFLASTVLLFTHALLYGDPCNSTEPPQSSATETPAIESEKGSFLNTYKHPFSDKIKSPGKKDFTYSPRSIRKFSQVKIPRVFPFPHRPYYTRPRKESRFKIREWNPDPRKHHFIAELMVRKDIDYKILNMISTGR